jgi:retron-type reverse transcriptase
MVDEIMPPENNSQELERFLSLENFRLAWRRIRNSERLEIKDRLALNIFGSNTDVHLRFLIHQIEKGNFQPAPAERIYTPKKSRTLRPFPFLNMHDRLVYQALGNIIIENSYNEVSELADRNIFASLPQKPDSDHVLVSAKSRNGQPGQFEKFRKSILEIKDKMKGKKDEGWIVKTDIAAFYPSIDHNLLVKMLKAHNWLNDKSLINLLQECLKIWAPHDPEYQFERGVPIGYETSDILATLFLLEVDIAMADHCLMLRYVDDMFIFATSRSTATKAIIELDQLLQKRSLILQTSKTEFDELSNSENDDDLRLELELQERLSLASVDLDGLPEDAERAQEDLYKTFFELTKDGNYEKYEAQIAFILYRLNIQDETIKNFALSVLLDKFPARSLHITKYLTLFRHDKVVVNKLSQTIHDPYQYSQVRANCLRALIEVVENPIDVLPIAKSWIREKDWYLRLISIDLLQYSQEEYIFLRKISRNHEEIEHVRASAFAACFNITGKVNEKQQIIKEALEDKNPFINFLGIYLWRFESDFTWNDLQLQKTFPTEFDDLLFAEGTSESIGSLFRKSLYKVCDFEISPQLPLHEIFKDVAELKQYLEDAETARQTNANLFIRSMAKFSRQLSASLNSDDYDPITLFPNHVYEKANERVAESMANLIAAEKRLPIMDNAASVVSGTTTQVFRISRIPHLLQNLSVAFAIMFEELHQNWDIIPPNSLKTKIDTNHHSNGARVFISYKREDVDDVKLIRDQLEHAGIQTWMDVFDLPEGSYWDDEIWEQGLKQARAIVVVVTPDALNSQNVKNEYDYGFQEGLLIIPYIIRPCAGLQRLSRLQYIDSTKDKNALEKLIKRLKEFQR